MKAQQILFLGDSITDCDHCFTKDNLGTGYVKYMADGNDNRFSLINGGVDGFTLSRIERKWQRTWKGQCFNTVFLLGGINDIGDVMGDLNKRRGRVLGMNPDHKGNTIVEADIPMSELYGYSTQLRSMTGGSGTYEYEFARYEQAPADVQQKEIEARQKVAEE